MATLSAVTEAIVGLGGTAFKSISRQNIKIALGSGVSAARVNNTLKKAVASGKLVQDKGSYKLPHQSGAAAPASGKKPAGRKLKVPILDLDT